MSRSIHQQLRMHGNGRRGFTLVELMVAITGGLFVSIVVFLFARDGSRFYQRESRVANATLATIAGFDRLRADIARAGFLSTPNLRKDPLFCGNVADPGWSAETELQRLASLRIEPGASVSIDAANKIFDDNDLTPDRLVLMGSYASIDHFPVRLVEDIGSKYLVYLQTDTGPMVRLGYHGLSDAAEQANLLKTIFRPGRALRILDKAGGQHFGKIAEVVGGVNPVIELVHSIPLRFRTNSAVCGIKGFETGALANAISIVQYDLRNLNTHSNFGGANTDYEPLYSPVATGPFDESRTELVRVELDTAGTPIDGTEELVAEYAVDLKFGITVAQPSVTGPTLKTVLPTDTDDEVDNWAGDPSGTAAGVNRGPHLVRSVRVRLSVRSREADRDGDVVANAQVAPGLYRIALGPDGAAPFARVRTLQADIALRNQMKALWP